MAVKLSDITYKVGGCGGIDAGEEACQ